MNAFCGDNAISYEFEQKSFNLQKENPVEVLNVHCTVLDQAGNEKQGRLRSDGYIHWTGCRGIVGKDRADHADSGHLNK